MGLCSPEASRRKWVSSCAPLYTNASFFPFLESDLERTQKCAFETPNSPLFVSEFLGDGNLVFLRFFPCGAGKRNHETLGAKQGVEVRVNLGWGPEMLQTERFAPPSALFRESKNN